MAYLRDRRECLTGCQDRSPWSPKTDLQYDFIMVYGIDDEMPARVREYRERGYVVHLMTGSAWGEYQDYLSGGWDGKEHWDESQMDRHGKPILHGVDVPYLCPSLSFCRYLARKLQPAVDAGVEAIHLEEPEFWDEGGYSEGFKREYQAFYGEPWQPPHLSCENHYRASALKVHLYKRLVETVSREIKEYACAQGREIRFYVPTHSLVNYTQWKILSPEGTLLDIPTVDGCIAQVWTGTARCGNVYAGRYDERTFETAFLEYGIMQELVRGTGRRMWFLHDPVEDNPEYTWEDFRKNYLKTVAASLMHPAVHHYEVSPWPTRVMNGVYPKKWLWRSGIQPGEKMENAKPIPPDYAELLSAMFQLLGDMDQSQYAFEDNAPRIGLLLADSGLYQRTFPDDTAHSPQGVDGLNEQLISLLGRRKKGEDVEKEERAIMEAVARNDALYNDYVASAPFPQFFGLAMPLIKAGVPLRPVQLENISRYEHYLKDYDVLILSYEFIKPRQMELHAALTEWVVSGGTLLYVGDGSDPYHHASGWWNTNGLSYADPSEHLFEMLGLGRKPAEGSYTAGRGRAAILRTSPARITLSAEAAQNWREWVRSAAMPDFAWKNHFVMRRGPYLIASVMEESVSDEPLVLNGTFADLLSNDFSIVHQKTVAPGSQALLFDLNMIDHEAPRIIGTAARIEELRETQEGYTIVCKAAADIQVHMRLKLQQRPIHAFAEDESGLQLPVEWTWNEETSTALLAFASTNRRTVIRLRTEA